MADSRAYDLEWLLAQQVDSKFEHPSDPLSAAAASLGCLTTAHGLARGTVVDAIAYLHAYRVILENGRGTRICTLASPSGFQPFGARSVNTLPLGCFVWVALPARGTYGVIIAAEPSPATDASFALADYIHMASRCGLRVDRAHSSILTTDNAGGATNWAAGRPFDSLPIGEWGAITETGLRVILDSQMVQLGADEATGITCFYQDQLLRQAGVNWQEFSAGHELERWQDEGELVAYHGQTPYPWEQLGALVPSAAVTRTVDPAASQITTPYYASVEPRVDNQMAFHRLVNLGGYVGQGGSAYILAPPTSGTINTYGASTPYTGLLEEHRTLAGTYSLRAAKSVVIAKRHAIPAPRRLIRPDNPTGDTPRTYRPAGLAGTDTQGPAHKVTSEIPPSASNTNLQRMAALEDIHAHLFNWENVHPLAYHTKDWLISEESASPFAVANSQGNFADLSSKHVLAPPTAIPYAVDHRYTKVPYTPNDSHLSLLDDGGVSLEDGYGASLRMTGGSMWLTAAGDLNLQVGRNINIWAGRDLIFRAKADVDISSATGAIRAKADTNFHILAGNSETGGVLIESKSPAAYDYQNKVGSDVVSGGIQFKAAQGPFVVWANDIYLRTGGGDVGTGSIVLDASASQGDIVTRAHNVVRFINGSAADYFGDGTATQVVNTYSANGNLFGNSISANGIGAFTGGLIVQGQINVVGGHIATELAAETQGKVGSLDSGSLSQLRTSTGEVQDDEKAAVSAANTYFANSFATQWYAANQAGNDDTIRAAGFSFRTTAQCKAQTFELWEAPWQQTARLTNQTLTTWTEPAVRAAATDTYPYPGERCVASGSFMQQDLALVDSVAGTAIDRGPNQAAYETPTLKAPTAKPLNTSYLVIP